MKQLSHKDIQNQQQQFPITIVCDAIRTPENIGMCFRIAESFGVSKIYLHESSPATENNNVKRTARNTVNQVAHSTYNNFDNTIQQLKEEGNTIIGIEITDKSIDIQNFNFKNHKNKSIKLYDKHMGGSTTMGNETIFYSKQLSKKQKVEWDSYVKSKWPILFNKYLKRYEEK